MNPTTVFCPPLACPARGQIGQGNMRIHSQQEKRCRCTECRRPFTTTKGPAWSRLRTSAATVTRVGTLRAPGGPLQAMGVACGVAERTVAEWWQRAGVQGQALQEPVVEPPRDLGQGQADESRVKQQGGGVWLALARMVSTRLWLARSAHRVTGHGSGGGSSACAPVPSSARSWAVPMACAPPSARCTRPCAIRSGREPPGLTRGGF